MQIDYSDEFAAYVILEAARRLGSATTTELVDELDRQSKARLVNDPWPWRDDGWPVVPSAGLLESSGRRLAGLDGVFDGERWIAARVDASSCLCGLCSQARSRGEVPPHTTPTLRSSEVSK
jgi:hypothetical protein